MPSVSMRALQRIDWNDLSSVIAMAKRFGPGQVVVKHDNRANYNITHASRTDLYNKPGVRVIFNTTTGKR